MYSFLSEWEKILNDDGFLFKRTFFNMIDYLENSLKDPMKNKFSDYDREAIDYLLYWNSQFHFEKQIIETIFTLNSKGTILCSLFKKFMNITYFSKFTDKYYAEKLNKELKVTRELVLIINSYLKSDTLVKDILNRFSFNISRYENRIYISLLVNSLLTRYSRDYLKGINYVVLKSIYSKNLQPLIQDTSTNPRILSESENCINFIQESLKRCVQVDIPKMFDKDKLGVSRKVRYLYHIYKYFIISKMEKNDEIKHVQEFYETSSVKKINTISILKKEFFKVSSDYIVKIMLDYSGINIFNGFSTYFEALDELIAINLNEQEKSDQQKTFPNPRYHKIGLGRVAIPSFSSTLQEYLLSDFRFNKFPRSLDHFLTEPEKADWNSPAFTTVFLDAIKEYFYEVFSYIKSQTQRLELNTSNFLSNILTNYINDIARTSSSIYAELLPDIPYEEIEKDVIKSIEKFLRSNDLKYFISFKIKDIDIDNNYLISSEYILYNKQNVHLGYYFEIYDFFYEADNGTICALNQLYSRDKDSAILKSLNNIRNMINTSYFLNHQNSFYFYGYQSQISTPKHSLQFHVLAEELNDNVYGDTHSNQAREKKDNLKVTSDNLSFLSLIKPSEKTENRALITGFDWFHRGSFEIDPSTKLLFHWIGLEQLFTYYDGRNKMDYIISRILANDSKSLYSFYSTYFSLINRINGNTEFGRLIENDPNYKKYSKLKSFSLTDFETILPRISEVRLKKDIEDFIQRFIETPTWTDEYNDLINEQKFKMNRIISMRNRIVHSGGYDNRYYIFADQLEKILKDVLIKLSKYPRIKNFTVFFKETEFLLFTPF